MVWAISRCSIRTGRRLRGEGLQLRILPCSNFIFEQLHRLLVSSYLASDIVTVESVSLHLVEALPYCLVFGTRCVRHGILSGCGELLKLFVCLRVIVDHPLTELARVLALTVVSRQSAKFHLGQPSGRCGAREIAVQLEQGGKPDSSISLRARTPASQ